MTRTFTAGIVAAGLFLAATNIAPSQAQEIRRQGRYFVSEITKSFSVKKGGTLRIFDIRGDVRVTTWDKNEVRVHELKKMDVFTEEEARTVVEKSLASYRQENNVIEIGGQYYRRDWIKSDFTIVVPRHFNVDIQTRGGDLSVEELAGDLSLRTSGGDISVSGIDGILNAKTSGGDITVTDSKKKVTLKTSGGDIDLRNIGGPLYAKTSGGDITLQGSEADVEIGTSGGDIEIFDVKGTVKAHTSGGDVNIRNTEGSVKVTTSGGDMKLTRIGGLLEASTSGGDIEGRTILGSVEVSTSGGSIELRDVHGGARARTAGGDILVEITLTDFKKEHSVDLRTAGGEITLYLPEKLPATIVAEIRLTNRWEDYNIYSDFPLTSSEEKGGKFRGRRVLRSAGDINGGGDSIELYTTNGDIYIKKLKR